MMMTGFDMGSRVGPAPVDLGVELRGISRASRSPPSFVGTAELRAGDERGARVARAGSWKTCSMPEPADLPGFVVRAARTPDVPAIARIVAGFADNRRLLHKET